MIPQIIEKNGHHSLLVDGKPFFVLGAQAHNFSAWPRMLSQVFSSVQKLQANTLEIPIYWEPIEPIQGQFQLLRIQNGDETDWGGPGFGNTPAALKVSLITE